jgi:hypothetical protein
MPSVGKHTLALELKPTASSKFHKFTNDGGVLVAIKTIFRKPFLPYSNPAIYPHKIYDQVPFELPNSIMYVDKVGGDRSLYLIQLPTGVEFRASCSRACIFETSFSEQFGYSFRIAASDIASFAELDELLRAKIETWLVRKGD